MTLFMTEKEALMDWCNKKQLFSSVEITRYGLDNFYKRAERTIRDFAADPKNPVRRISQSDCLRRGLNKPGASPIAWWEV